MKALCLTVVRLLSVCSSFVHLSSAVASPGFVARRGKAGNQVMGHSRRTSGPGAVAA